MATRKLQVEIVGDASSLHKALGNATSGTSKFSSKLATLGKVATLGVGAAFAGMAVLVKNGFDEIAEGQKVSAQTEARLKSTGKAANVTAKDVEALAVAQSKLTGIDDEAVQAGENMLLTFTRIRNEVGKGNDIFNQATVAVEDMATAMADGAVPSAEQLSTTSIRVGKALNDPIKGMTALARVGVSFDEGQKKLIKTMVESGDTMGAQKLILAELTKEFGGSAKAAGQTLPGELARARNGFDEMTASIAVKLLPVLTKILEWVNTHWTQIGAVFQAVANVIGAVFVGISKSVEFLIGVWQRHEEQITATWQGARDAVQRFVGWFQTNVMPVIRNVVAAITAIWNRFGDDITKVVQTSFGMLSAIVKNYLGNLASIINAFLAILRGDWGEAWSEISEIPKRMLDTALTLVRGAISNWATVARALGAAVKDGIVAGLGAIASWLGTQINAGLNAIRGAVGAYLSAASALGAAIKNGVTGAISGVAGAISGALAAAAGAARSAATQIGQAIIAGVLDGLAGLFNAIVNKVSGLLGAALHAIHIPGHSPIEDAAADLIGEPIVLGAIRGIERLGSSLSSSASDVVLRALESASSAFAGFSSIVDVGATGGGADELVASQAKLQSDLTAVTQVGTAQRSAVEKEDNATRVALQALWDSQQLVAVQTQTLAVFNAYKAGQNAIMALFDKYLPLYYERGKAMGEGLADGLLDARGKVKDAADALARAVAASLGVAVDLGRAAAGNAEARTEQGRKRLGGLAGGGIVTRPTLTWIGERGPEAVIPLNQMAGGNTYIAVNVPNYVGDQDDLISAVRRGLFEVSRRNPGSIPGAA